MGWMGEASGCGGENRVGIEEEWRRKKEREREKDKEGQVELEWVCGEKRENRGERKRTGNQMGRRGK